MATEQDGMLIEIGVTEKRYLAQLAKLEAQTMRAAKKTESGWKSANARVSQSFQQVDRSASAFARGGMRNVSLQLSQVAQQATATGDPLRALAIQLPDLALGFGTLGIALGAVAGALLPLAIDLFKSEEAVVDLDEAVGELGKSVDRYRDASAKALTPTSDLRAEWADQTAQAQALYEAMARLERLDVLVSLRDAQQAIGAEFGSLGGVDPSVLLGLEQMSKRLSEINDLTREVRSGSLEMSQDQFNALQIEGEEIADTLLRYQPIISQLREEYDLTAAAAGRLAAAAAEFQAAQGTDAAAAAAARLRAELDAAITASGNLTDEQEQVMRRVLEAEMALISFVDSERDAEAAAADVKGVIDSIDLSGPVSQAQLFAVALGGAADQAARAVQLLAVANRSEFQRKLDSANPDFADPRGGVDAPGAGYIPPEILPKLPPAPKITTSSRGRSGGGGGGGGGGSTSASLKEVTEAARQALQILEQVNRESVTYADIMAELQGQLDAGKISQDQFNDAMDIAEDRFSEVDKEAQRLKEDFGQMFASAVDGAESLSDALESLLSQLSSMLINDAFSALFSSGGGGSIFSALFNANGNAFQGGRVVPFATGGVVSGPTAFNMRGPNVGIMGEAGPEAILPLTRINGKLGVRAEGGGGAQFTYAPVIDARGADPSVLERIEAQQRRMAAEFEGRVHGVLRTGRNTRRNKVWSGA